jgi:hypothetical protein
VQIYLRNVKFNVLFQIHSIVVLFGSVFNFVVFVCLSSSCSFFFDVFVVVYVESKPAYLERTELVHALVGVVTLEIGVCVCVCVCVCVLS